MNTNAKFEYKSLNSKFIISDPSYQRAVDMNRVGKIVSNFNGNLVNPIKVSSRDNMFYVFDGQHTLAALKVKNGNKDLLVECKVYEGLTKEDEAKLFSEQNGFSRTVESIAKFKALYAAKDIDVCQFKELTESIGIKMDFTKGKAANKIVAVTKAYKIYNKVSPVEYLAILSIIKNSWGGIQDSFNTEILGGIYHFCKTYKGEFYPETLEKQLSKVSPLVIIREGNVFSNGGDTRFARQILIAYNNKLRKNRLIDKF